MLNKVILGRSARLIVWGILAMVVIYIFRGWIGPGLPISPRREAMAPFTYIWQVAQYLRAGYAYVDWDPSFFAGYPWLRFLQSTIYYLAALLSILPGMSLPLALKVFIIATYVLSGWTMSELVSTILRKDGRDEAVAGAAGLVAGIAYAVFPFHVHLGIEIISHGAFWAILPLPFLVYEARSVRVGLSAEGEKGRAQSESPQSSAGHDARPTVASNGTGHDARPTGASDSAGHDARPTAARGTAGHDARPTVASNGTGHDARPTGASDSAGHDAQPTAAGNSAGHDARPTAAAQFGERAAPGVLLGVALALYIVTDIEHALLVAPFAGLYVLLREAALHKPWRDTALVLAVALAVSAGLSAYCIVPALAELVAGDVGITARFGEGGTAGAQFARDTGLSGGALLAAVADRAGFTYRPADLPAIVFGFFGPNSWYVGIAVLALAALGLGRLRRSPIVAIALALLLLAFAWAARAWLPVNLFGRVPYYGTLSGFRGMIHIGFFLCLLAGIGAGWLLSNVRRLPVLCILAALALAVLLIDRPRATLSYAVQVAILLGLATTLLLARRRGPVAAASAALLLVAVLVVDFRTAGAAVISVPGYFEQDEIAAYRWLAAQGTGFRLWEYSDLYDDAEFLHTFSLAYNQTPRFGGYYDNGATGDQWRLYKWAKPERGKSYDADALRSALKVSSVRYVLVHKRSGTFDEAISRLKHAGFAAIAWESANITILEDSAWQPLAVLYGSAVLSPASRPLELAALEQAAASNRALLASTAPPQATANEGDANGRPVAASVSRQGPYRITVRTDNSQPGYLVLAESWHANWRVTVDGKAAKAVRANVAFIGVRLDAGKHDVLYSYRLPSGLLLGWAGTIVTILALAVWRIRVGRP